MKCHKNGQWLWRRFFNIATLCVNRSPIIAARQPEKCTLFSCLNTCRLHNHFYRLHFNMLHQMLLLFPTRAFTFHDLPQYVCMLASPPHAHIPRMRRRVQLGYECNRKLSKWIRPKGSAYTCAFLHTRATKAHTNYACSWLVRGMIMPHRKCHVNMLNAPSAADDTKHHTLRRSWSALAGVCVCSLCVHYYTQRLFDEVNNSRWQYGSSFEPHQINCLPTISIWARVERLNKRIIIFSNSQPLVRSPVSIIAKMNRAQYLHMSVTNIREYRS